MGLTIPVISIGAIFCICLHLLLGGIFTWTLILPNLVIDLKLVAEILALLVWVVLLLAHKVIICFDHGHFIIMKRASIQEILYSRDVHVAICDLLP